MRLGRAKADMLTTNGAPQRVRWEVLWVNPTTKKIERKQFGHDHSGAVKLYARVVAAGRRGVTLRSMNMGFPPPDQYADREEVIVSVGGKRKRGKRMIEPRVYIERMGELNLRGIWWCPYCCELRKFVFKKGRKANESRGKYHNQTVTWRMPANTETHLACPMCGVDQGDSHVKRYNPAAATLEYREGTVKNPALQTDAARRRRERRAARKLAREKK